MSRQAAPRRNIYYNDVEMRCKEGAIDGGIYDFVVENAVVPEPKQVPLERQAPANKRGKACKESPHSCQSVLVAVQRMLCIITIVVVVSFLTAAGTLALAFKMILAQNNLANDCSTLRESYPFNDDFTKLSNYIQGLENNITTFKKNLEKMEEMITNESNTKPAMWRAIETNSENITKINLKVINVSKMHGPQGESGPRGPPGYNGTQGPPGPPGLRAHNDTDGSRSISFSQCHYKESQSVPAQPGIHVTNDVEIVEENGKKFLGVNCGTNDAKFVKFKTTVNKNGTTTYRCDCKGTLGSGAKLMYCYIHYWECPA